MKIIDPDDLNQGTELNFDTANRTIELIKAGNLSDDGVALQAVYSFTKEEWKSDDTLIRHPFPFTPIDGPSGTQFDLVNGWKWKDVDTINLIRDGGFAVKKDDGTTAEEWMNITSLGAFYDPTVDQAYYIQGDPNSPVDTILPGEVNQCIKIYGDADNGDFDKRNAFTIFLREEQKTYDQYDLIVGQNISALTYKKYALPLSDKLDTKVTHSDAEIAQAPYDNITITYYDDAQQRDVGGTNYDFSVIVEGDNKTLEQIYEKHQYLMRQESDIDNGEGDVRGDTADTLMYFIGDTLYVNGYIDNVRQEDSNRVVFIDDSGSERVNPFTSAGILEFNAPLQADPEAIYHLFFTTDGNGNDFGTDNAITVEDASGIPIAGTIDGNASIPFDYDFDSNDQRGAGTEGTDAPVTLVGIGLDSAQYVVATGTITRSKTIKLSLVANTEMTYVNN